MASADQWSKSLWQKLWGLGCSLKLAIFLASATTLLIMGGSLIMHFNPAVFAGIDQEIMAKWLPQAWDRTPHLIFWVPLSGLCVLTFGINTLCCLIDWLSKVRARWRKTGEYLVHSGFILLVIAYFWGNVSGFRSGPHRIFPGDRIDIPDMPGYSLTLEEFTPQFGPSGRPLDMVNSISLWKDGENVAATRVRINHPLMYDGLLILPTSFGQDFQGFRFSMPDHGVVDLTTGSRLLISPEIILVVHKLLPDARRDDQGRIIQASNRLNSPAMQLSLWSEAGQLWEGWYFLRHPLPKELRDAGVLLRPVEPIYKTFSLLTINRDPGDKLALTGSVCISVGVIFAFFSFYRKREQGDRPEV